MMWWNGVPLPVPSAPIHYEYRCIEGTNSGETLGGTYSKKIIARKEDLLVVWDDLSEQDCAVIGEINNATYGTLTYYSPAAGKFVSKVMHVESHIQEMSSAKLNMGALSGTFSANVQFRQR